MWNEGFYQTRKTIDTFIDFFKNNVKNDGAWFKREMTHEDYYIYYFMYFL